MTLRLFRVALMVAGAVLAAQAAPAAADAAKLDNAVCLACHDGRKGKLEVAGKEGAQRPLAAVNAIKYAKGTHGDMQCVDCHREITD
ncbi:MAG: cytochrome C, partial [Rhodocyclales bacterium]|nr:cytochrome C [Rhodocyclales bacterium]